MDEEIRIVRETFTSDSWALSAFDYLLAHAGAAGFRLVPRLSQVRSVELQWKDRRLNPFSAQASPNYVNFYLRRPILREHPSLFRAAEQRYGAVAPNRLGEYRRHLASPEDVDDMLEFLRREGAWPSHRHDRRFLAATYASLSGEHFLRAAQRIAAGFSAHRFGPSTDYDLLFDGKRLPPKAVFGLAATEALGFPVRPENFSGGEGMLSFRMLRAHGYPIVPKGQTYDVDPALVSDEDRTWSEGRPKLVMHLRRERGAGLAAAKRAQFRALHGRLYCERCKMDPVKRYGLEFGEGCIEVHHRDTHLANMEQDHETMLDDLACLCANCHRITHRELKAGLVE